MTRKRNTAARVLSSILALGGIVALAACNGGGGGGNASKPTPTPPPSASTILTRAKQAAQQSLKDTTFTYSLQGNSQGVTVTVTGTGKETTNPKAEELTINGNGNGQQVAAQTIVIGNTTYTKKAGATKWTEQSTAPNAQTSAGNLSRLYDLQNPMLVGPDTVNGIKTWHLKGTPQTQTTSSGTSVSNATEDLWVRQDNYYPVKVVEHVTGTTAAGSTGGTGTSGSTMTNADDTVTFTAWNTGVKISPPPANDVVPNAA